MKPVYTSICLALTLAGFGSAQAQKPAVAGRSLGDVARQLKSKREKALTKPQTVFTNDNLPARPKEEGLAVAGGISPATGEMPATSPEAGGATETAPATSASEAHNEKYYRKKMADLQTQLDLHQRQLAILQQKTAQNEMQYYPDPQKTLNQEFTRSDVNKLITDVDKKKQDIAADHDAMDALRDQLRRDSGNPGWLR